MRVISVVYITLFLKVSHAFVDVRPVHIIFDGPMILRRPPLALRFPTVPLYAKGRDGVNGSAQDGKDLATPLDRPILAMVDAVALTGFAAVGKASHSGPNGTLEMAAILQTALPFLLAWFATSPLTGVYQETDKTDNLAIATVKQTLVGWALAIPLGCAFRGVLKGYLPPTSFVIVTLVATLVILSLARIAFAVLEDFFVEFVN